MPGLPPRQAFPTVQALRELSSAVREQTLLTVRLAGDSVSRQGSIQKCDGLPVARIGQPSMADVFSPWRNPMLTKKTIDEWRSLKSFGMISALGEYTPDEFWYLLDEYEQLVIERDGLKTELERIKTR